MFRIMSLFMFISLTFTAICDEDFLSKVKNDFNSAFFPNAHHCITEELMNSDFEKVCCFIVNLLLYVPRTQINFLRMELVQGTLKLLKSKTK